MKKPIVICVSIHKGGSAKTTVSGNLGYALGKMGYKVLLVDTDAQKNLSSTYGFIKTDQKYQNKNFFTLLENIWGEDKNLANAYHHILPTSYKNIDIIIGSRNLARASEGLSRINYSEQIIGDIIKPLREKKDYDFIIFDTDSTLGTLNTSILQASDGVIISLTPTSFGIDGLATFISHFKFVKKRSRSPVEIYGIVFSDIDKREVLSTELPGIITEYINKNEPGIKVFDSYIPKDANINKSQGEHMPVAKAYPSSRSVKAYDELAKEVVDRGKE